MSFLNVVFLIFLLCQCWLSPRVSFAMSPIIFIRELRLRGIAFQGCSGLCHWDLIRKKMAMRGHGSVDVCLGVPMWVTDPLGIDIY